MILILEITFWIALVLVLYTFAGYPLLMAVIARACPRPVKKDTFAGSFSIVLSVHNEEQRIGSRLQELTELLAQTPGENEIIVVSDGSSDLTAAIAGTFSDRGVRVLELKENAGKSAALSLACQGVSNDVIVFCDVRQRWDKHSLDRLLQNFSDANVGAVSGELELEKGRGLMKGVGLYWRIEKWMRRCESNVHSTVGVTGAICAVRRELFRPIPQGTILDDVYWPLQVVMQGRRVVFERGALAYDRLPENPRDEFKRKVRTLSGNFQLLARLPAALIPWRNPVWFQFLSHKVLRLAAPWCLWLIFASSILLGHPIYTAVFALQIVCYLLGILGISTALGARLRPVSAAGSFLMLNVAAWLAFWVWVTGNTEGTWHKVVYEAGETLRTESTAAHMS